MDQKELRHPTRLQVIKKRKIGRKEEVVIEERAFIVATVATISPIQRTVLQNILQHGPATLYEVWDRMHFTHQSQADAPLKKLAKDGYLIRQTEKGEARNRNNRYRYYLTDAGFIEAMNMILAVIYEDSRNIMKSDDLESYNYLTENIFGLAKHAATKHPSVCPLILRKYDVIAKLFAVDYYVEDENAEELVMEPLSELKDYDPFCIFSGRIIYAECILECFEALSEVVPFRCKYNQRPLVTFEEIQKNADALINVAFFYALFDPEVMPILVEPFVDGLMKDQELAAIAHKGISLYYNELFCYMFSIKHMEALFRRYPTLKMDKNELCVESLDFEFLVSSWEDE